MTRKLIFLVATILLVSSANSAVIECYWSGETCSPNIGTPITQPNDIITISGKPATYVNTVTTFLGFSDKFIVRYIPANIFPIFTNLKWLQILNSGITNLVANFSMNCPALEQITIDDGFLQEVPEGFLQSCSNVKFIGMRNHQITTIDKNAFRGLAKLENIEMSRNKLTCLHPDLFQYTPLLIRVFFTYNKINALDRNLLRNLKQIAFFDVKYNSISYLPAFNLTSPATYAMAFYASGNPIYAINPNFCSIYTNRRNYMWIKSIPCLPTDTLFYRVDTLQSCQAAASILQSCYANWSPAISDSVVCGGQGSGVCIPSNVWSKFAEFVNYLPV